MRYGHVLFDIKRWFFCFLLWSSPVFPGVLIQGDAGKGAATTFTFPVLPHVASYGGESFFVGAHPDGTVNTNEWAISYLGRHATVFSPLAPETVSLNGSSQNNPLHNQKIKFLSLLQISSSNGISTISSQHPVAVPANDLLTFYIFNSFAKDSISMVSKTDIQDASTPAGDTTGMVGISTASNCVFSAVRPKAGGATAFGDAGSGIAFLVYGDQAVQEDGKTIIKKIIQQSNTAAFDKSSDFLKIGGDLQSLTFKDMYWDAELKALFVSLDIKSEDVGGSGGRAVAVGFVKNNQLVFKKIVPDGVFDNVADDEIIGTGAQDERVVINKIRTMKTSNWLNYLIVQGGNEDMVDVGKKVFALPLVNDPANEDAHGTIAKFDSTPDYFFLGDKETHSVFRGRFYNTPATQNADILKTSSERSEVGRDDAPEDIVDMVVKGDTVYVAVDVDHTAGDIKKRVYSSRAIFDTEGRILDWTPWQVTKAAESKIFGFDIDSLNGNVTTMENDTPNNIADDKKGVKSIRRTDWGEGDKNGLGDFGSVLGVEFPKENGGIHGLFDIPSAYQGVDVAGFMIATGLKKVVIAETERSDVVNKGNFSANLVSFGNGTITQTFNAGSTTRVVVIEGGVLDDVGPIECAGLAWESANNTARIFVGGPGGLAVLANPNGSGIANPGLQEGFEGLLNGMLFKTIGDYAFVRRLVADDNFLYVLTDTQLDRIDLVGNNFTATTLATVGASGAPKGDTFLDIIVSGKLCVLGTSSGLFRTGNGADISTATSVGAVGWTQIETPGTRGPALYLNAITKDGLQQGLQEGGNLEVLNAYIGKDRAKLNRYVVADVSGSAVSDQTFTPFLDGYLQKREGGLSLSYFVSYGTFRNGFSGDGAFALSSREKDLDNDATLRLFSPNFYSGMRFAASANIAAPLSMDGASEIVRVLRSSASGDILVARDSGLGLNE